MQAASRESLAVARDRVDGLVDSADPAELDTVADELFSVARLLDREPALRRALADPSTESDARANLATGVLGDRIRSATAEILGELVRARWSRPADLAEAVVALGRQVTFGVAERAGALDEVEDELFRFGRILAAEPRLRGLLEDRSASADRRVELLHGLTDGRTNATTARLLEQAVRSQRAGTFGRAVDELVKMAADRRERYLAYVQSPVALSAAQEERLAAALSGIYGRAVSVRVEVDPELLGGLVVRVNDEVIDGSVATRLAEVRHRLAD